MYLKVEEGSPIYSKLFATITTEGLRQINFKKWQIENLPEFNNKVIVQHSPWYLYPSVIAWKFTGEVDTKMWQPMKGFDGFYEPNKRTKAGKEMRKKINEAQGKRFNRMGFFNFFETDIPMYGKSFTIPNGFIYHGVIYMVFDDGNYKDISTKMKGQYTEITHGEWDEAANAYNNELNETTEL